MSEMVRLGDVVEIYAGTGFPVQYQGNDCGKYPFYKVGDIAKNVIAGNTLLKSCDNHINDDVVKKIRGTIIPNGSIVFAKIGEAVKLNRRAITSSPCLIDNNVMAIKPSKDCLLLEYLFHYMCNLKLEKFAESTTVPSVKKSTIEKIQIPLPPLPEQRHIAAVLDKVSELIALRKRQLDLLDDMVKARFVEMFGDPVYNTAHLTTLPMPDVCEIIDGDRGKNYPKQSDFYENEYCLFLNAKNVTKNGFEFSECMFISKEKDKALRKGKLKRGDIILTTRGTLGNLAFYTDCVPYENVRINSGMVILRMNRSIINEIFFIEQFRMQVDNIKRIVASGTAQSQLPISTMNKIHILITDLNRQVQFADFVQQVEKSKATVQQGLDRLNLLKSALMQEYFG